jgi:hypothetical protein
LFLLPPPPGSSGASSAIPARPSGGAAAALVQLHPPKPPPRPAGGSHCLGYHLGPLGRATGWWVVGGRGHRKAEGTTAIARARQLGSPSASALSGTKEPWAGWPPGPGREPGGAGAGSPRTRFFLRRKPLDTYLRSHQIFSLSARRRPPNFLGLRRSTHFGLACGAEGRKQSKQIGG